MHLFAYDTMLMYVCVIHVGVSLAAVRTAIWRYDRKILLTRSSGCQPFPSMRIHIFRRFLGIGTVEPTFDVYAGCICVQCQPFIRCLVGISVLQRCSVATPPEVSFRLQMPEVSLAVFMTR